MVYRVRRIQLDNRGEIVNARRRTETIVWPTKLKVGGLYFLRQGKLYRVEEELNRD